MALLRGQDFYKVANLTLYHWDDPLIVFPGMTLYFIPFSWLSLPISKVLYYIATLAATLFTYVWIFKLTGLLKDINFKKPDLYALLFFACMFCYFNSSPVLTCLRHGQSPTWTALGFVLFFTFTSKYGQAVVFGLLALMKYSMVPLFGLALFFKKHFFVCLSAFGLFIILAVYPLYMGYNVFQIYQRYIEVTSENVTSGFNSFAVSGYNMLQIEFFKLKSLNMIGKAIFACLALWVIFKERKNRNIGLNLLFFLMCCTMLLSYHRLYDANLIMLLLLVKMNFLIRKQDWNNASICGLFLFFFIIPLSWIFQTSDYLGSHSLLSQIFYTCSYEQFKHLIPIPAWVMILLTLYSYYLYKATEDDWTFKFDLQKRRKDVKNAETNS
jgi:hypothetical protein